MRIFCMYYYYYNSGDGFKKNRNRKLPKNANPWWDRLLLISCDFCSYWSFFVCQKDWKISEHVPWSGSQLSVFYWKPFLLSLGAHLFFSLGQLFAMFLSFFSHHLSKEQKSETLLRLHFLQNYLNSNTFITKFHQKEKKN